MEGRDEDEAWAFLSSSASGWRDAVGKEDIMGQGLDYQLCWGGRWPGAD
jgi:hypothetical protein